MRDSIINILQLGTFEVGHKKKYNGKRKTYELASTKSIDELLQRRLMAAQGVCEIFYDFLYFR
jgi:hypothetical protein